MSEHSTEFAQHDYRAQSGGRSSRCARCGVVTWDAPWEFVATWNPETGALPTPILRLFRHRSTVEEGRAAHQTDKGHATYYVRAVETYLGKHLPDRSDIKAEASEMPCSPAHPTQPEIQPGAARENEEQA